MTERFGVQKIAVAVVHAQTTNMRKAVAILGERDDDDEPVEDCSDSENDDRNEEVSSDESVCVLCGEKDGPEETVDEVGNGPDGDARVNVPKGLTSVR